MGIVWEDRFSENIREFEGYPIGKLLQLLNDPEIISLAGGLPSPDIFLKEEVRSVSKKRLDSDIDRILQYSPVHGEPAFLQAVVDFLKRDNIQITTDNLLITSSGQQGLDIVGRLFLNPGDGVIVDRPTFSGAIVAFQMQRARFHGVHLENDGSDIDGIRETLKTLASSGRQAKFIYVVPDFQNPSGITMSLPKRKALLDLSYQFHVPVIEDSPYRDLRYYGETLPSLLALDQARNGSNVLGVFTFSKLFCPGMRIGFNIGPPSVIAKMMNIKEGNLLNTPKYNQDICTSFLTEMDIDAHIKKCRDYYREKLDCFLELMEKHFPASWGVNWTKPEGGLFLWATLPDHVDTKALFYDAIKHKVAFVPGESFYGQNPERNHMRINFSYPPRDRLAEGVERLAKCIEKKIKS
jgi:2-aminoadipate transaminase